MATKNTLKCSLCDIDFTSTIPLEMHLRGAKHAKKIKSRDAQQTAPIQAGQSKDIASEGKSFRCDLCKVHANSSLQYQTHLEGTKHKNKLKQGSSDVEMKSVSQVNGKSNGSTVRSLPSDFGEPQPAKLTKFSCDICSLVVNSDVQLQQHLTSKKHQAKVEGKPLPRKKKARKADTDVNMEEGKEDDCEVSEAIDSSVLNETTKTVVGVKTLSSSFVQGETLQ